MFTGIVKRVGRLVDVKPTASGLRLRIDCAAAAVRLAVGDSICVSGVCLTVTARDAATIDVDAVPETLARTTLGTARPGTMLNLEPAATPDTALGGHLVQGHIDATTVLVSRSAIGAGARLAFRLPPELARYLVAKGSVTVDGVSLTVAAVSADAFEIAIVPHTMRETTLGRLEEGASVNLEVDVIAKYVERLLQERGAW
ncbi:MAG TPA: riboflavin synthase [Candidatus Limnocylindria bacterium]|jgi:riboflavin synthase